jgi:hypothetical protein
MGIESELSRLGSVRGAAAVDLSSADYTAPGGVRGIYVGVSGDVKVDLVDGSTGITFVSLAAGVEHAIAVTKIYKTGTTATSVLALK